jgi:glutamate N-acetyltransferase/amino-acid N-acetyltransferase
MDKLRALENVPGFKIATTAASIRDWEKPRDDMALIVADAPAAAAAVFTTNQVAAAPVKIDKKHLKASGGLARAILVNAGVANACTGKEGKDNALACVARLAEKIDAPENQIFVASTGVIGRQLPMDRMEKGIDAAFAKLGKAKAGAFSKAIMTTDLKPKTASADLDDGVVISGACKGSGMMAPNMATMLSFILTNASVSPKVLKAALDETVGATFNMVSVDGDTSTNDSLFVLASGVAEAPAIDKASGKRFDKFLAGLYDVAMSLSRQIAIDGEGATKLVKVRVINAKKHKDAVAAARTIAESPLVKTAMFGNDPNGGRIMMALGRSPAKVEESKVGITLCGRQMFLKGAPVPFDAAELSGLMKAKELELVVDLGLGKADALMLTCDFSYDYVKINADYTT